MKNRLFSIGLLFITQFLSAQTVPVTFHLDAHNSQYQTVVMFGGDSLKDDDGDRIFEITKDLSPGRFDYLYWIDNALGDDPDNTASIMISDPMITYLLPKDGDMLRDNQIRADFAYTPNNPPIAGTIAVSVNGNNVANAESYFNSSKRTLIIDNPPYLIEGKNVVTVSYRSNKGKVSRTSAFTYHSVKLFIAPLTYRMERILGWGRVFTKPYPATVFLKSNNTVYEAQVNENGYFGSDIVIQNGANTVKVAFTEASLNTPVDEVTVNAELRHNWWVELAGTLTGTTAKIEAISHDTEREKLTYQWKESEDNPQLLGIFGSSDVVSFQIPKVKGEYQFELSVTSSDGTSYIASKIFLNTDNPHFLGLHERAPWMTTMTLYESEASFYDWGTYTYPKMKVVLPHLKKLGINSIMLPPMNEGGYVTDEHFNLNLSYGTKQQLIDLINTAHDYGIKVILDVALGHTNAFHPFLRPNYFIPEHSAPYDHFYKWEGEPGKSDPLYSEQGRNIVHINLDEVYGQEYVTRLMEYWMEEFGADGFRFDSGQEMIVRSPEFATSLLRRLKNIKPDCWILIEGDDRDHPNISYYDFGDSAYDWKLSSEWGDGGIGLTGVYKGKYSVDQLDGLINWGISTVVDSGLIMNYANVDYHDYLHNLYGWEQEKSALAIVFTTYGLPLIFQGEEVGAVRRNGTFDLTDPMNLMPFYTRLIKMRQTLLGNFPKTSRLTLSNPNEIYAYTSTHDTTMVLNVSNFTATPKSAIINLNDAAFQGKKMKFWSEITDMEGKTFTNETTTTLNLAAWESKVFMLNIPFEAVYPVMQSIEIVSLNNKFTINNDGETLELNAVLNPANCIDKVEWSVEGAETLATIANGIVTPCGCGNGEITVVARSKTNPSMVARKTVTISEQTSGQILNPNFDETINEWSISWSNSIVNTEWDNGRAKIVIPNNSSEITYASFSSMAYLNLEKGKSYRVDFDAYATKETGMDCVIKENGNNWEDFAVKNFTLSTQQKHFAFAFKLNHASSDLGQLILKVIGNDNTVWFDNVRFCESETEMVSPAVTFQVNMQNEEVSPNGVYIKGNWDNWDKAVQMQNVGGTIYSTTLNFPSQSEVQYKFTNGDPAGNWQDVEWENFTGACTDTWTNRIFNVQYADTTLNAICFNSCEACETVVEDDSVNVTFRVDLQNETISSSGVYLNGSFCQWNTTNAKKLTAAGTVYSTTLQLKKGQTIEYKFVNGAADDWAKYEILTGLECAFGKDANRGLVIPENNIVLDVICYNSCNACTETEQIKVDVKVNPASAGTIMGTGTYSKGQTATLVATPNEGFEFTNWTLNGTPVSSNPNYTFTINQDVTYQANFEAVVGLSVNLTFQVNMKNESVAAKGVFLNGNFCQSWANPVKMKANGDIYSATVGILPGMGIEYKFINGDTYEDFTGSCTSGEFNNRQLIVPYADAVLDDVCFNSCQSCPTSVFEKDENKISFYPNPTTGKITINGLQNLGCVTISIFDVSGKLINRLFFEDENTVQLNLEALPIGMYQIHIITDLENLSFKIRKE